MDQFKLMQDSHQEHLDRIFHAESPQCPSSVGCLGRQQISSVEWLDKLSNGLTQDKRWGSDSKPEPVTSTAVFR